MQGARLAGGRVHGAGQLGTPLGADLGADLAGRDELTGLDGQLTRGVDEIPALHGRHVGGQRRNDRGQFDAELGEPSGRAHFGRLR